MSQFNEQIKHFNRMYNLGSLDTPTLLDKSVLVNFKSIILEEVEEADDIIAKYDTAPTTEVLTDISDWLGDMIVYCRTFANRFGLPMEEIQNIIMESNFSKLGADGLPIYDARGKLMKGSNYWKPEPRIKELLEESLKNG